MVVRALGNCSLIPPFLHSAIEQLPQLIPSCFSSRSYSCAVMSPLSSKRLQRRDDLGAATVDPALAKLVDDLGKPHVVHVGLDRGPLACLR